MCNLISLILNKFSLRALDRELATRLSALRAELRHVEATSEYLNDLFGDQESPNVLILEIEEDMQTLARDIRIVESRYEYVVMIL